MRGWIFDVDVPPEIQIYRYSCLRTPTTWSIDRRKCRFEQGDVSAWVNKYGWHRDQRDENNSEPLPRSLPRVCIKVEGFHFLCSQLYTIFTVY